MTSAPARALPRLADFIRSNTDDILSEWESFARAVPVAGSMDIKALRDHARQMLAVIANDLETPQSTKQEGKKSRGEADASTKGETTAAQEHGAGRAGSGFTIEQMVAEFRSLRATVIRLWMATSQRVAPADLDDMTRFNEAIDQAIAESVARFNMNISQSKERFLAILGHDLKNPIGSIMGAAQFMLEVGKEKGDLPQPYLALLTGVANSSRRMNTMVHDLLDFARTSFGDAIPIERSQIDVGTMICDVQAEVSAMYPGSRIETKLEGDLSGNWDGARLAQALTNLDSNAVQHGDREGTISISARGLGSEVIISVTNRGALIRSEDIAQLFKAMKGSQRARRVDDHHLGLGLYIVDKIVEAHGGKIVVQSTEETGTVFTIHLARS
jgi:signal transduction histidine kinase